MNVRYVVEVNDCGVQASRHGLRFWANFQCSPGGVKRITWIALTPGGGTAHIACDDREEAAFVRDYMVQCGGLHAKHVKVRKITDRRAVAV
jgi:hypothetical protein